MSAHFTAPAHSPKRRRGTWPTVAGANGGATNNGPSPRPKRRAHNAAGSCGRRGTAFREDLKSPETETRILRKDGALP